MFTILLPTSDHCSERVSARRRRRRMLFRPRARLILGHISTSLVATYVTPAWNPEQSQPCTNQSTRSRWTGCRRVGVEVEENERRWRRNYKQVSGFRRVPARAEAATHRCEARRRWQTCWGEMLPSRVSLEELPRWGAQSVEARVRPVDGGNSVFPASKRVHGLGKSVTNESINQKEWEARGWTEEPIELDTGAREAKCCRPGPHSWVSWCVPRLGCTQGRSWGRMDGLHQSDQRRNGERERERRWEKRRTCCDARLPARLEFSLLASLFLILCIK